jgi:hypothetical protein
MDSTFSLTIYYFDILAFYHSTFWTSTFHCTPLLKCREHYIKIAHRRESYTSHFVVLIPFHDCPAKKAFRGKNDFFICAGYLYFFVL